MGCCLSCLRGYRQIPDDESGNPSIVMSDFARHFRNVETFPQQRDLDVSTNVFQGTDVELKYVTKGIYEPKFVWVNLQTRTINMSKYKAKERSHKEASLMDVSSIVAGVPVKYRPLTGANGTEAGEVNGQLCLTLNFHKGGGIDLKFASVEDRNLWFDTLNKIVSQNALFSSA